MSDIMRLIPFDQLMKWILEEYKSSHTVFGVVPTARNKAGGVSRPLFAEKIESPFGPAAGPHTQLCQNIVAAYVAGCSFFELKTVQIMDGRELAECVKKPCITAKDECYNCEWSTELTVQEAFDEYVKGWFACKLLARELELVDTNGFVFNMSVGYTFEGIQSPKIDNYIEGLKDASPTPIWQECQKWTLEHLDLFKRVDEAFVKSISSQVCSSITLSTLHGCPPQEIERIAVYLIEEKKLNTYVKCNPTLLGYDFARKTLDDLGFDYMVFDDHHFKEDLQFSDAVPMFRRLIDKARSQGLEFGVKLTNTFPVDVAASELPSEEMYMSGRSLFPLSIEAALRISKEFNGQLRISYSGGADVWNIRALLDVGIWPVTMATTILKPGGYQRFAQIAQSLEPSSHGFGGVNVEALAKLAQESRNGAAYRKPIKPLPNHKLEKKLPLLNCFTAPCRVGCPIGQDIPAYLRLADQGDYDAALAVITERNPLPFITGTICPHRCTDKCCRSSYEDSVHIREVKLEAAEKAVDGLLSRVAAQRSVATGIKVAVVGAGPAGISAASLLARGGVDVTVFERADVLGGVVRQVIPGFRISNEAIERDVGLARAWGVRFETGKDIASLKGLKAQGYDAVIAAIGAWKHGELELASGQAMNVIDFLLAFRENPASLNLGESVVIIGGGNTAMDAARAALKVPGVEKVRIVYRRTKRYMPADEEELVMALEDEVEFCELLAPLSWEKDTLWCQVMRLGAPDSSGRRSVSSTDQKVAVPATAVIASVGESIDSRLYVESGVSVDKKGRPIVDPTTMETSVKGIYAIGDGCRGAATVVEAIADATAAATAIAAISVERCSPLNVNASDLPARAKKGQLRVEAARQNAGCDGARCLECATVCELCVDVCPNRANVSVRLTGQSPQIVHVDGMCNECGNCATFCPYNGRPYTDKFTLFWNEEDFTGSENEGFLPLNDGLLKVRLDGQVEQCRLEDRKLPDDVTRLIAAVLAQQNYMVRS